MLKLLWRELRLQRFRRAFAHRFDTQLVPTRMFDLAKLRRAGRHSYGALGVMTWNNPEESLEIGDYVALANETLIQLGGNHGIRCLSSFPFRSRLLGGQEDVVGTKGPVIIDDDVWIGTRAMILSGVHVSQGAVVGAGSVVTRDVPPYAIVAGNPARVVRYRFSPGIVRVLLESVDFSKLTDDQVASLRVLLVQPLDERILAEIIEKLGQGD